MIQLKTNIKIVIAILSLFCLAIIFSRAGIVGGASLQEWQQVFPTGVAPAPRYSAGNAYDVANDRLIIFSGEDYTGLPRPIDVWVLANAITSPSSATWIQLSPQGTPPLGREGGTTVYDPVSNSLIVHGGCTANCSPALRDTWVLSNANGLGGTPTWSTLPNAPIGRAFHSAQFDSINNRMIIFGGNRAFSNTDRNDVWVLVDANGIGTPYWTQLLPIGNAPTPREYITSAYDSVNNRLIIFGGFEVTSSGITRFNDTWILTHANGLGGVPEWSPLAPNGTPPSPRSEASAIYNSASNEMILFGGLTSSVSTSNETWVLKNANGLDGTPEWVEIAISGDLPLGRWGQSTGFSPTSNNVVMAMGRNDTPNSSSLLNDVWVLGTTSLSIELDVKPNDSSNSLNPSSKGVIPVAILSTSEFDAMSVNPSSIRFGLNEATIVHKQGHIEDVDNDGDLDLLVHFKMQETGISCGDTTVTLAGQTFDGEMLEGTDQINTVGCK